jgi:hypothetical protein
VQTSTQRGGVHGPAPGHIEREIKRAVELQVIAEKARALALAGEINISKVYEVELTARRAMRELIGDPKPPEAETW